MITDSQRKALEIVQKAGHEGIRPREFAKAMWPDSDGWKRSAKSGPNGSHRGGGMYTAGGAYLGKLLHKGWLRRTRGYRFDTGYALTHEGLEALDEAQQSH